MGLNLSISLYLFGSVVRYISVRMFPLAISCHLLDVYRFIKTVLSTIND